jgi:hypothetical protein
MVIRLKSRPNRAGFRSTAKKPHFAQCRTLQRRRQTGNCSNAFEAYVFEGKNEMALGNRRCDI